MADTASGPSSRERGWYRGDCHVHSVHSDGELTPDQLTAGARSAGLDFLATTEHNTAEAHGSWEHSDLLVILGEEVTTRTGHWLALGLPPGQVVDWRYGVGDGAVEGQLAEVRRAGGLCVAAHPHAPYPSGTFMYPYEGFDAVEVWNGPWDSDMPWQADNDAALAEWGCGLAADVRRGRWRPAMGNSDTHLAGQIGIPHTVVRADELTMRRGPHAASAAKPQLDRRLRRRRAVVQGLRGWSQRRYRRPAADRGREGRVRRGRAGRAVRHGQLPHRDRDRAPRRAAAMHGSGTVEWRTSGEEAGFVRVEVRTADGGMAALSNPVVMA